MVDYVWWSFLMSGIWDITSINNMLKNVRLVDGDMFWTADELMIMWLKFHMKINQCSYTVVVKWTEILIISADKQKIQEDYSWLLQQKLKGRKFHVKLGCSCFKMNEFKIVLLVTFVTTEITCSHQCMDLNANVDHDCNTKKWLVW